MYALLTFLAMIVQKAHAHIMVPTAPCPTITMVSGTDPLTGSPIITTMTIPGCSGVLTNILFWSTIPTLVRLFLRIAGAGAVAAIVVAGLSLIVNAGDDSKVG